MPNLPVFRPAWAKASQDKRAFAAMRDAFAVSILVTTKSPQYRHRVKANKRRDWP